MNAQDAVEDPQLRRIDEATQWLETLRDGAIDESTLADWFSWSADAGNLREFERLQQIWNAISSIDTTSLAAPAVRKQPLRPYMAWAAGISVVLGLGGWWFVGFHGSAGALSYDTAIAVISDIPLADGSHVKLAPRSKITARLTQTARTVEVAAGEAYFEVAKDPLRPFRVDLDGLRITAIGTAFNVHRGAGQVRVTVTEGAVSVSTPGSQSSHAVEASAGEEVKFSFSTRRLSTAKTDPRLAVGWHSGVLKFVDEPLQSVVADLNRYSERQIQIADGPLGALPYTGTVFAGRIDQWLLALQDAFPLYVEADGTERVVLKMK